MIVLWLAPAFAADCPAPAHVATFDAAVARAELGVQTLDAAALDTAIREADALLPCLDEPIGADHLARWYRARAVHRFVQGDPVAGVDLFRSAKGLQPAYKLDPDVGGPVLEAYAQAVPGEGTTSLPKPVEGWVVVDGRAGNAAPMDRPFVVQWFGSDGGVRVTALVAPGTDLPYPLAPTHAVPLPPPVVVAPSPGPVPSPSPMPPTPVQSRGHLSRTLALSGLGAGVLAGAGVAVAAALQEELLASQEPSSEHPGLIAANRAVGYGAGGVGVAAIGLGIGAVVVGRW